MDLRGGTPEAERCYILHIGYHIPRGFRKGDLVLYFCEGHVRSAKILRLHSLRTGRSPCPRHDPNVKSTYPEISSPFLFFPEFLVISAATVELSLPPRNSDDRIAVRPVFFEELTDPQVARLFCFFRIKHHAFPPVPFRVTSRCSVAIS